MTFYCGYQVLISTEMLGIFLRERIRPDEADRNETD